MKMTVKQVKEAAHAAGLEFIMDRDGDVCIRPMHFDDDGRREVRYQPDPCEFKDSLESAAAKLGAKLGAMSRGVPKTMSAAALAARKKSGFKKGNKAAAKKSNKGSTGSETR